MSAPAKETAPAPSACCGGKIDEWLACAEKCATREPLKTSLIAFLAGLIVTVLPVGALLGALARLTLAMIRPLLILLGAMKVFEEIEKRRG
jgi:hypothetical protein